VPRGAYRSTPPRPERRLWAALLGVLALGLVGAGGYLYYAGNPFLDLDTVVAQARDVASVGGCTLLDITGSRTLSAADLRVSGIVGPGEKERVEAALRQIPGVGRVGDDAMAAPPSLCPVLRAMAPLWSQGSATLRLKRIDAGVANTPSFEVVQNGASPAFVYVDAFWPDGSVAHLVSNKVLMPGERLPIEGRSLGSAMPMPARGPAVISAIASSGFLLPPAASPEDGVRYATALKKAVDDLTRGGKSVAATWRALQLPGG